MWAGPMRTSAPADAPFQQQVAIFSRIADFYGVTLDYLVGRSEERT